MEASEIRWNEQAREKILHDADRVLRDVVLELAEELSGRPWSDVYEQLFARLQLKFIDFQPGRDLRTYAEATQDDERSSAADARASTGPHVRRSGHLPGARLRRRDERSRPGCSVPAQPQVRPHRPVVAARERELADEPPQRPLAPWPEHT